VHIEIVRDGETGFLVKSADEWVDAIRMLARDPDLRRRMGAAGRRVVEERYSVEAGAKKWLELINSLTAA
jgi:glycosyltransferase involved in cell wall biosynthesis